MGCTTHTDDTADANQHTCTRVVHAHTSVRMCASCVCWPVSRCCLVVVVVFSSNVNARCVECRQREWASDTFDYNGMKERNGERRRKEREHTKERKSPNSKALGRHDRRVCKERYSCVTPFPSLLTMAESKELELNPMGGAAKKQQTKDDLRGAYTTVRTTTKNNNQQEGWLRALFLYDALVLVTCCCCQCASLFPLLTVLFLRATHCL